MMKRFPQACKDGQGQAAGRGRRRRPRLRAGREPDRQGRRRAGGRQCPRPFGQRDRDGHGASRSGGTSTSWPATWPPPRAARPDRRRGRRRQGRASGPGRSARRGSFPASAFRRLRRFTQAAEAAEESRRARSSPTAAFATRATSPRRIAAGAHAVMIGGLFAGLAESPGEQILYQGRTLQGLSRHGLAGGHGARAPASATAKADANAGRTSSCPKASKDACPSRDPWAVCLSARRRAAGRHGLLRTRNHRGVAHGSAIHPGLTGQCAGESSS